MRVGDSVRHKGKTAASSPLEAYLVKYLLVLCFTLLVSGCAWRVAFAFVYHKDAIIVALSNRYDYTNFQVAATNPSWRRVVYCGLKHVRVTRAFRLLARCHQCCDNYVILLCFYRC